MRFGPNRRVSRHRAATCTDGLVRPPESGVQTENDGVDWLEAHAVDRLPMKVSAKAEYACLAVLELAVRHGQPHPVPVKDIADAHGIPSRYLTQILLQLKGGSFVKSVRGSAGGYQLAKRPDEITLVEILTVIDGPLATEYRPAGEPNSPGTKALVAVFSHILQQEQKALAGISFADLVRAIARTADNMYFI